MFFLAVCKKQQREIVFLSFFLFAKTFVAGVQSERQREFLLTRVGECFERGYPNLHVRSFYCDFSYFLRVSGKHQQGFFFLSFFLELNVFLTGLISAVEKSCKSAGSVAVRS